MKNRLQTLWDEVMLDRGPCPQPDVKKVRRRVDAALDSKHHIVPRRALRLAMAGTAAVLLLTGTALAGGELIPPEYNVLNAMFTWGGRENPEAAIAMMTITPVSVEDDNYTMTVTSSLADENKLYFTLLIEAKHDEARERLETTEAGELLSLRVSGSNSYGISGEISPVDGVWHLDVSATWKAGNSASVRLNTMDENVWLTFPVKPVRSLTLEVNAEGLGLGGDNCIHGAPVTVSTIKVSPLSYAVDYTSAEITVRPVVYFLFKDGSLLTMGQMDVLGPSGGSAHGMFNQYPGREKLSWRFPSVQDLSLMEAVVFGGMAYPLDGGEPYEVDLSAIPQPFAIPTGELLDSLNPSIPLFALCDGLGADYEWDEAVGTATASFRGTTLTFTVGNKTAQVDGPWNWDTSEEAAAPVYQDGKLWVAADSLLRTVWSIKLEAAAEDSENAEAREDHSVAFTTWVVNP